MTTTHITVPSKVSRFQAFQQLWNTAKYDRIQLLCFEGAEASHATEVATAKQVDALLKANKGYLGTAGGRVLNVNFNEFPKIDVIGYDRKYGDGAALRALEPNPEKVAPIQRCFQTIVPAAPVRYGTTPTQGTFSLESLTAKVFI